MKVWGLWYGGVNYGAPGIDDVEEFSSIAQARRTLEAREEGNDSYYPCVECSEMVLFDFDPRDGGTDWYRPFRRLVIGPRGGVREKGVSGV